MESIQIDGIRYFDNRKIRSLCELSKGTGLSRYCQKDLRYKNIKTSGGPQKISFIHEDDFYQMIKTSKKLSSDRKKEIINEYFPGDDSIKIDVKQARFVESLKGILMAKFPDIEILQEVHLGTDYRYDVFIKDFNIVLEFDEAYHGSKKQQAIDKLKEIILFKNLEIEIIRIPYKNPLSKIYEIFEKIELFRLMQDRHGYVMEKYWDVI